MDAPDYPVNEASRLLALKRTALLDSPAEARFDRITRLAARYFNVKTCLISLIDNNRQWFKSKYGLDAFQTARDVSFCGHAILQPDIFVVTDTTKDPRFFDNPLVIAEPKIRFYAGAPIHESSGHVIGTLCLIDSAPRVLTDDEAEVLRDFANMVEHEIANLEYTELQKRLLADSKRTSSILATLPDMVFVVNRNLHFLVCNEHPDLLKPNHEIIGRSIKDILDNPLGKQLTYNVKQAFKTGDVIHHNYKFEELNKSFEARYRKIDDNEVLIIIRNITQQVIAETEMRRLSEVVKQTTNGVVITDSDGLVTWINEAFTGISGYNIKDIIGREPSEILQGENTNPETVKTINQALSKTKSYNVDILNYSKSKKPYWVRIACNPLLDELGVFSGYIAIHTDVTKEKQDEDTILSNNNLLKAVIDANTIGTWRLNLLDHQLIINDKWAALLGYELKDLMPTTRSTWENLTHPQDLAYCVTEIEKHVNGFTPIYEANIRMKHKNGDWVWVNTRGRVSTQNNNGEAEWLLGTHFDINDQIKAESSLDDKSKQMQAIVESMLDGVIRIDSKGEILTFNNGAEDIFGYQCDEIIGRNISILMDSSHSAHQNNYLSNFLARGMSNISGRIRELDARHKNGMLFPIELSVVELKMTEEINYIGIVRDITQRKKREQEIHQLAFYDSLTQLPNRRLLLNKLQNTIAHCSRNNTYAALLFLDLDNFKDLNDSAGHDIGDALLCQVAARLTQSVRQVDTVSRLGGDEFVVILEDLDSDKKTAANQIELFTQKIINRLTQEFKLEELIYNNSASIGITMFNNADISREELLKQADMAMYKAKEAGRNGTQFFDPQMQVAVKARATLAHDLYEAFHNDQFSLFYQKQVNQHGEVIGVEALLRWFHPNKGMISPAQFIPLAEETSLIVPLGEWILKHACETLSDWSQEPAKAKLCIAVNISVVQFSKKDFVEVVLNALSKTGADAKLLKLEITETLLASNVPDITAKIRELQQHGITFSIDDFGTGYSSLAYLKKLPLNQLKIDQGFVKDIINSSNDKAIAQAVITLASAMNLEVIAEGVETEAQRALLEDMGCNTYQGYLFGKPCALADLQL